MPKRLAFLCVTLLILSTSSFAQDAPVTDCDKYAASDVDPQRKAAGIPFINVDPALAVPACEDAVRQFSNNPRLIFQLGRAYHKANNFTAALTQYRKAADQNYPAAQNAVGVMYSNGQGVRKDDQQATAWFQKATDQGLAAAQTHLGVMYYNGLGVPPNFQQAFSWFRKAADQNNAEAIYNLGVMYANGQGVPKDIAQAVALYRKAADQNWAAAENNLGTMYELGQGVPKDVHQAVSWYRKAADQGFAPAQTNLNRLSQASAQLGQTVVPSPIVGGQSPSAPPGNAAGPIPRLPMTHVAPNIDAPHAGQLTYAQSMAIDAANNAWKRLPAEELTCIQQQLQQTHAGPIESFIRNGIPPSDPRLGQLVSNCAGAFVQRTWKQVPPEVLACMNQLLQQKDMSVDALMNRGIIFSNNQASPDKTQAAVAQLYNMCHNTTEKAQLLANPTVTLDADDQESYDAKLMNFINQNRAMAAATKAADMADAAQICTNLFGNSGKCNSSFNNANQTGTLTSFQSSVLGQLEKEYLENNFIWTDNTQLNNWHCNVVDVIPGQTAAGGAGVIIPGGGIVPAGASVDVPGRPELTFHNGGQIICVFDFPNVPAVTGFSPPDYKVTIQINFEDSSQFASLSRKDLIHFDARAFCPKSLPGTENTPGGWTKCLITSLTFMGQRVTNK